MSANTIRPDAASDATRRLRDSSAALLAQAGELRDSSAALLAQARDWGKPNALTLPQANPTRLVALDAARVLATFGVMWTHIAEAQGLSAAWAALGRFGTSFYILAAVYLSTRAALKRPDEPFRQGLRKRALRLLIPFGLWSAIYGAYYASLGIPRGESIEQLTLWWGPFAGTARHLWFLPFAFTAGTLASLLAPHLMSIPTRRLVLLAGGSTAAMYWFCYRVAFFALDRPSMVRWHLHRLDRWVEEIPLMVLAVFATALYVRFAQSRKAGEIASGALPTQASSWPPAHTQAGLSTPSSQPIASVLLLVFVGVELLYLRHHGFLKQVSETEGRFLANLAGICLLGSFLAFGNRRWLVEVAPLGRLTYFAFLAHVLLIDVLSGLLVSLPGYGSTTFALVSCLCVFVLAILLGALARRSKALRWLIP